MIREYLEIHICRDKAKYMQKKIYGRAEAELHIFLTSALHGGE
jgi:hypothetical protein